MPWGNSPSLSHHRQIYKSDTHKFSHRWGPNGSGLNFPLRTQIRLLQSPFKAHLGNHSWIPGASPLKAHLAWWGPNGSDMNCPIKTHAVPVLVPILVHLGFHSLPQCGSRVQAHNGAHICRPLSPHMGPTCHCWLGSFTLSSFACTAAEERH